MESQENTKKEYIREGEGKNTIELSRPYGGIQFVDMREPTVQDLLSAELQAKGKSDAEQEITMFANLCEITPDFIKGLGLKDYKRIQESYRLFTE
ncbi:phage tail assembly protein [Acinetobacter towneri]|uniref:phage tail assembly protein n=1 Tax=Acinetobacter towneri TaxID=202956 RepID=UPI0029363BA2|nr:phage tail assembly protein [Acinetobacter towneri]MDV2454062.1 phage tail assembly protein [Acinetobacter towneri]